jgi:uncharacterized protein involved in exopolysaccharide biosynthesis
MNKEQYQNFNDEVSLKELVLKGKEWFNYLTSQWKIILLAGFIGGGLGLTYSLIKEPVYTATLTFVLDDDKSGGGIGGALGLASSFGIDVGGNAGSVFSGANLVELFKSRAMVEKTLLSSVVLDEKKISLVEMYIQNKGWRERWNEQPKLNKIQFLPDSDRKLFTRVQDSILGKIYRDLSKDVLSIEQKDKKTSIINLEVTSINEQFSKYFSEALIREVSSFYIDTKSKKSRENMMILEHQTDSIRGALNGAITGVAVANDNTFNLNPALNIRRAPSARRQVDVQANTAILTELIKQTELAKVTLRKETPLIKVVDYPILPLPMDRLSKSKGIVIGGVLVGFLSLLFLVIKRIYNQLEIA